MLLFSLLVMIMTTQNGLNIAIYEMAKPYIIENYCVNKAAPELKCDGKCHLTKVIQEQERPVENPVIPSPDFKFNPVYFMGTYNESLEGQSSFTIHLGEKEDFLFTDFEHTIFHPPRV